jgi:hypothetical protein
MADVTFNIGEEASLTKFIAALDDIHGQGKDVLDELELNRIHTLVEFGRRLSAMNGRRQRANRVSGAGTPVQFVATDFLDIDQTITTATVRSDSGSATLRERSQPVEAQIKSKRFTSSIGTIESLDNQNLLFRVGVDPGQIPVGTFDIELASSLGLSLMVFDIAATPSAPGISVEVSPDGVAYAPAVNTSLNGYRISSWTLPGMVRFVRLKVTPSQADTISGNTFTFGLTDFYATSTEYQLASELVTKPVLWAPDSTSVRLTVDASPGLTYFLAVGTPGSTATFVEVTPGTTLQLSGTALVSTSGVGLQGVTFTVGSTPAVNAYIRPTTPNGFIYRVTISSSATGAEPTWPLVEGNTVTSGGVTFAATRDGLLNYVLPTNAYLTTLSVVETGSGLALRVAPGLSYLDTNVSKLINKYAGVVGQVIRFISSNLNAEIGQTFTVSYVTGPAQLQAQLKVQFSTSDRTLTPVFRGARLERVA